jgi:hypothetical protein
MLNVHIKQEANQNGEQNKKKGSQGMNLLKAWGNMKNKLRELRQQADYIDQIPTPAMAVDTDYSVLFMNQGGANAVGRTMSDCIGKKCFSLFNTGDCNTEKCAVSKAFHQNNTFTSETIARLPSGELPIRYTDAPVKDSSGKTVAAVEFVLDVAKEKKTVARMTEVSEKLAKASEETTAASEQSGSATEQIASVSQQVAKGAEEQTRGIGEVNGAIGDLGKAIEVVDKGSKEQSRAVEQATGIVQQVVSSSQQLSHMAEELKQTISLFKLVNTENSGSATVSSHESVEPAAAKGNGKKPRTEIKQTVKI